MYRTRLQKNLTAIRGFTLIEIIVAIGLFTVVAVVAVGALIVLQSAARRAQATRTLADNAGFIMEDIVRTIQAGISVSASATPPGGIGCDTSGVIPNTGGIGFNHLTITDKDGNVTVYCPLFVGFGAVGPIYKYVSTDPTHLIKMSQPSTPTLNNFTNVKVTGLVFMMVPTTNRVSIILNAAVGGTGRYKDEIILQTSVTLR